MSLPWRMLVHTLDAFPQPEVVVAAERAGCTGVLALAHTCVEEARSALELLLETNTRFGVSVLAGDRDVWNLLESALGCGLTSVVLQDSCPGDVARAIQWCKRHTVESIVEVVSLAEALHAVKCGADAVMVKGSESGGRVGEETAFILLQRITAHLKIPVYARGGIGLHTGSACLAAGAAGFAVDWQLALAEESSLPEQVKNKIARMDGSETAVLGQDSKVRFRAYSRVGETAFFELKKLEESAGIDVDASEESLARWRQEVHSRIRSKELLVAGQDAAFAAYLASEYRTVRGICSALRREASRQLRVASRLDHLGENGPLAKDQGTRFPILQGPMTRVSDNAAFAAAVAKGGALPFLALALMRGKEVAKLLIETQQTCAGMPWGVGILGFVPKELRDEQLAEVLKYKPPYAVIAGGRPDMAKRYEAEGIHVFLHVPSPELLRNFLEAGARRIIFEGRECGGHVGPRTSFVLWEQMIRTILSHLRGAGAATKPEDYQMIFAGGIHDAMSSAMVAAITAPLAERGVRVGVVIGTGYLFTREIVGTNAITPTFQEEAIACTQTVLVESGVGHATRCADSQFAKSFAELKGRLLREGKPKETIREELEGLNLGRLRIASKGIIRHTDEQGKGVYAQATPDDVRREGMFMIGQVAALRDTSCTVEELHRGCAAGGSILRNRVSAMLAGYRGGMAFPGSDIAIVGMSCVFPEAGDIKEYWQNIQNKVNALREIPKERFDSEVYFDPDRKSRDKIYSKWGGFIGDVVFDPMKYGMPPASLPSIDPLQMVTLEMVHRALADAGYTERKFNRENTCCVVGTGGGVAELGMAYGFRSMVPYYVDQAGGTMADSAAFIDKLDAHLPEWTEDSFAGFLLNVVAGRVANRFDLGGTNFIVDAACATGLAALRLAVTELETRSSDVAVVAAADMMQTPLTFLSFAKTQALSPTGIPKVFDEAGDGIVISEGVSALVLKRLDDALLDGDTIHGVIKSVGASSDGKDKGLTAPRPIGQIRAFERAYSKAGFDAATVGMMEAHGTGTAVGDRTEAESLTTYLKQRGADKQTVALGSVKSMIGHTKCAAGFAGLLKAVMATRHGVLPPTINVTKPNSKAGLDNSPLYINSETRPWIRRLDGAPRRAGVSAFGFGGTNFHAVVEEFQSPDGIESSDATFRDWPAELFLWRCKPDELAASLDQLTAAIQQGAQPLLADLAAAVYWEHGRHSSAHCLAIVATSLDDLAAKLASSKAAVQASKDFRDPRGIYYSPDAAAPPGKIAFSFPGQGSQSTGMMNDLAVAFPVVRQIFEAADRSLGSKLGKPLSGFIYPPPAFTSDVASANETSLKRTNVAQPALGAADIAMFRVLDELGIRPAMACGHSYGEFAALCAAGTFSLDELIRISELRGRVIIESAQDELGTMAAVEGNEAQVSPVIQDVLDVVIANLNGPLQTVISGTQKGVADAVEKLKAKGLKARSIPVACAFHSPLVAGATLPLRQGLGECEMKAPRFPVYSNTTAKPHLPAPGEIRTLLAEHLTQPVRFVEEIQAMYDAGARVFIECGPGKVLTGLASNILKDKPHVAINMDLAGRPGLLHLVHSLGQLAVSGVHFFAQKLFEGRTTMRLSLDRLVADTAPKPLSQTAWVVSNGFVIPGSKYKTPAASRVPDNPERKGGKRVLIDPPLTVLAAPRANPETTPLAMNSTTTPSAAQANPAVPNISAPSAPLPNNQLEMLMQGHHRLMGKFLETHRHIMMAAMRQPTSLDTVSQPAMSATIPAPPMMAAPPAPVAHPLPVDTPATVEPRVVAMAAPAVGPVAGPQLTRDEITSRLLGLVSQRTGYPPDMLGLDLDLEADLGVDSIKRVEIFGALQTESVLPPEAMDGQIETLSKLKTLRAIAEWVEARAAEFSGSPLAAPMVAEAMAAAVPQLAAAAPKMTRESITKRLLDLVSQRTGYPPEMLGMDLDLEADLGVDSIKRVEIFGALQTESILSAEAMDGQIETLSKLKTLQAIVGWIEAKLGEVSQPSGPPPGHPAIIAPESKSPELHTVTRMSVEVSAAPEIARGTWRPSFVLITDDQSGVATDLAVRLTELGIAHAVVGHNPPAGVDLMAEDSVSTLAANLREKHGQIAALVHLMPLAAVTPEQSAEFEARTRLDLKSLFLLVKALEPDLRKASGIVLSATRLGGTFGYALEPTKNYFAGNAAVCGFLKTVPREWSEVAARTVDFELDSDAAVVSKILAAELLCRDGVTEAGYSEGTRKTLRSVKSPLGTTPSAVSLGRDSVVLLTGGARGITAAIALEIANAFQPKIVLLGRSPLPPESEPADISGVTDTRQLKAIVMDRMQTGGQRPTPALVEGAVRRIKNEREIRQSIAALKNAGSEVEYHAVDVADAAAMGAVIDGVYAKYGRLDGVVHGAGIIEDKLISDKTPESFDRVIQPKIAGALSLVRKIRPENLQFLAFFSSVSARYGNRGQCDYSAANEVLDKLAIGLNSRWPGRVVSLNWGPWRTEGGMVSPELAARFAAAGVEMIEVPAGCRAFLDEITYGAKNQSQVVFGGPLTIDQQTPSPAPLNEIAAIPYPFAGSLVRQSNGLVSAEIFTDPNHHAFLYDHQIDGKAVLPMVVALEMLAETAAAARPNETLTAIRNLKNFQGITYPEAKPRKLLAESGSPVEFALRAADTGHTHYRAQAEYGGTRPAPPSRLILNNPRPFPLSIPEAYERWLFHGPKFGGILKIDAIGDNGIIGRLKTSTPGCLMPSAPAGTWLIDPLVADSSMQFVLVWTRAVFDQTPLPSLIEAYHFVDSFRASKEVLCEMEILARPGNPLLRCRPVFYNESGALIGWAEGVELNMSKSLNRISGKSARAAAV
jgi:acyl transferase domain-containing protein/NAD(P)H-dependent flavin oxidoreductase YrpB (nitropropane dioxygenase family)/NAD(P)-dependent dehydrogenase (short-subunit alcohol dehydrogenase family)